VIETAAAPVAAADLPVFLSLPKAAPAWMNVYLQATGRTLNECGAAGGPVAVIPRRRQTGDAFESHVSSPFLPS